MTIVGGVYFTAYRLTSTPEFGSCDSKEDILAGILEQKHLTLKSSIVHRAIIA
jgi:hypothetical protein